MARNSGHGDREGRGELIMDFPFKTLPLDGYCLCRVGYREQVLRVCFKIEVL